MTRPVYAATPATRDDGAVRSLLATTMTALDWLTNVERSAPAVAAACRPADIELDTLRQRMARVLAEVA